MRSLVLSTLLFHTVGTVVIMLGMAVKSCLPQQRSALKWEFADADVAVRSAATREELQQAA